VSRKHKGRPRRRQVCLGSRGGVVKIQLFYFSPANTTKAKEITVQTPLVSLYKFGSTGPVRTLMHMSCPVSMQTSVSRKHMGYLGSRSVCLESIERQVNPTSVRQTRRQVNPTPLVLLRHTSSVCRGNRRVCLGSRRVCLGSRRGFGLTGPVRALMHMSCPVSIPLQAWFRVEG
jgi:hypothetical protein